MYRGAKNNEGDTDPDTVWVSNYFQLSSLILQIVDESERKHWHLLKK